MEPVWDKVIPLSQKLINRFNGYEIEELPQKYKLDNCPLQFFLKSDATHQQ